MRYYVDNELFHYDDLKCLRFEKPSLEWLDFVRDNRRKSTSSVNNTEPRHSYDVVSGPIANDKVAIAVEKYCRGILTAEETLIEVKAIKNVYQLSMHTEQALSYINTVSYSQKMSKRWTDWQDY